MSMSLPQIQMELKDILLRIIDVDPEDLKSDANFFQDLDVDSIKALEMAIAIDKHFKVSINEELGEMTTLAKTSEVIFRMLNKK
jgi:acyl carrier protein